MFCVINSMQGPGTCTPVPHLSKHHRKTPPTHLHIPHTCSKQLATDIVQVILFSDIFRRCHHRRTWHRCDGALVPRPPSAMWCTHMDILYRSWCCTGQPCAGWPSCITACTLGSACGAAVRQLGRTHRRCKCNVTGDRSAFTWHEHAIFKALARLLRVDREARHLHGAL